MKRLLVSLTLALTCSITFAQQSHDYKNYEYKMNNSECQPKTQFIPTYMDIESYEKAEDGRKMMIGGLSCSLIFSTTLSVTAIVDSYIGIKDQNMRIGIYSSQIAFMGLSSIVALCGFYKWNKWSFNGTGITYTF